MKTWGTVGTVSRLLTFESTLPERQPFGRTLVVKQVWFTVMKEVGKMVKTWGRVGVRAQEFQKVGARAPRVQKGPQKGPKNFSIF